MSAALHAEGVGLWRWDPAVDVWVGDGLARRHLRRRPARRFSEFPAELDPSDEARLARALAVLVGQGVPLDTDCRLRGEPEQWVHLRARRYRGEEGRWLVAGTVRECTQARRRRRLGHQVSVAADLVRDAVLVFDASGRLERANAAADRLFAGRPLVGETTLADLVDTERDDDPVAAMRQALAARGVWEGQVWFRQPDHAGLRARCTVATIHDAEGRPVGTVCAVCTPSQLSDCADRLIEMTVVDPLTGLRNRAALLRRVADSTQPDAPVALALLNVRRFRRINSALGPGGGDRVLRVLADRLRRAAPSDALVARVGADEFALCLVRPVGLVAFRRLLLPVRAMLERPISLGATPVRVQMRVAIVEGPRHTAHSLLQSAADGLVSAEDRHQPFVVGRGTPLHALDDLRLEADLRRALAEQTVEVHYQPQVRLRDGALAGAEALARWTHPTVGAVPPLRFIAVARAAGMLGELTDYLVHQAVRQWAGWVARGLSPGRLGLNATPQDLQTGVFVRAVQAALDETGLAPVYLEAEVLEESLAQPEQVLEALLALKAMGVQVSIDDFGADFSSLRRLAELPIDRLKVDRSFVAALDRGARHLAVLEGILALAQRLSLEVVVEGVEQQAQAVTLRAMGCRVGQGFGLGRPVAPAAFEAAWLSPSGGAGQAT